MTTENDDQLVERLVPKILSSIRAKAKAVESLDIKGNLEGITSIPCYDTSNGIYKQVLVSIEILKEPAKSAADFALDAAKQANQAAEAANAYANRVRDVTEDEWQAIKENESWEEGVEYNVYSDEV